MSHTLLLADDSVTIQRVIELTFADQDISVVAFSNGAHAIASLDRTPPDIVLADVAMPGRTGYDLARHIKQTPALAHIPVLLLTGAFDPVDDARAKEAGCDGILTKPFEPHVVVKRVKELLGEPDGDVKKPAPKPSAPAVEAESSAQVEERDRKAAEVERYFDELDQAFASLANAAPAAPPRPVPVTPAASETSPAPTAVSHLPPLADAFAALLTAERTGDVRIDLVTPPPPPTVAPPAAPEITDDVLNRIVDRVVERVLATMTDRVVRETVADIASQTAEKLVREEIERIKSNVK